MSITVTLRKNRTGETRAVVDEYQKTWDRLAQFQWLENNYSCDCNRHLFWLRAKGPPMDAQSSPHWNGAHNACGDWRYSIVKVEDASGVHEVVDRSIYA